MSRSRFILKSVSRKGWRSYLPSSLLERGHAATTLLSFRKVERALALGETSPARGPLIVSGFMSGSTGVSRAARLTLEGLRGAGQAPLSHELSDLFGSNKVASAFLPAKRPGGVWLLHANPPEAVVVMARLNPSDWLGRYRIAYWAYELPRVPKHWVRASSAFHEIWAPSAFVADALIASGVKTPVRTMPHPVAVGSPAAMRRAGDNGFAVLTMGDLKSSASRKNLLGSIEIYKRAFPREAPGTRLIVKIQSGEAQAGFQDAANAAIGGRGDIALRTERLTDAEVGQMIASASVFLSPHRSEGYGLTIAEALLAGVPALATGWSGNMDFMEALPELLIAYALAPVNDAAGVYKDTALEWAEPNIDDAVQKLRVLAGSPSLRAELADRGRALVRAQAFAWSREALASTAIGHLVDRS